MVRVDHYGNLITNIQKQTFDQLSKDKAFTVTFGRESSSRIHRNYHSADEGDCFVLFNFQGLLEIGINTGNASELLGLDLDSPITIHFQEN